MSAENAARLRARVVADRDVLRALRKAGPYKFDEFAAKEGLPCTFKEFYDASMADGGASRAPAATQPGRSRRGIRRPSER